MGFLEGAKKRAQETDREIKRRISELRHDARELEAAGHEVMRKAIRTGHELTAKTPAEVRALGLAAMRGQLPQALGEIVAKKVAQTSVPKKAEPQAKKGVAKPPAKDVVREQARAGVSGAVDEFTLGAADHVLSAGEAIFDGGLQDFDERYSANMRERRVEDAYDSQNYSAARTAGRAVGFGAGMVALGGAGAAGRAALSTMPRGVKLMNAIAKAPKLGGVDKRGLVRFAAGGGAGVGLGAQMGEDVAARRLSTPGQYAAAAAGGAVDGLATLRYGPTHGGAAGAAIDSIGSDLADGRAPSAERAIGAAHGGAILGRAGDLVGTFGTAVQPNKIKGNIGEALSYGKTLSRGKWPELGKSIQLDGRRRASKPDQKIGDDFLEAKMGPYADLTKPQKLARAKIRKEGNEFIIDAWSFRDAGKAAGIIAAPTGAMWIDEDGTPWSGR